MPWINITLRRGALSKEAQHAMVARLTSALMWWEKIPRLTSLDKRGIINDFTKVVLEAEGSELTLENMHRVWVIITEIETDNWGIGGHRDWLRSYTSALDEIGRQGRGA